MCDKCGLDEGEVYSIDPSKAFVVSDMAIGSTELISNSCYHSYTSLIFVGKIVDEPDSEFGRFTVLIPANSDIERMLATDAMPDVVRQILAERNQTT